MDNIVPSSPSASPVGRSPKLSGERLRFKPLGLVSGMMVVVAGLARAPWESQPAILYLRLVLNYNDHPWMIY